MKELTAKTAELIDSLASVRDIPIPDFNLASLGIVDTSTFTDTLKAAVPEFDFSEVC
jgi:hypothetical protein